MKSSFLLNEYRNPICYLFKNVPCDAEEKIGLKECVILFLSHGAILSGNRWFFFSFFSQISLQSHGKQLAFSIGSSVTRWFLASSVSKTVILIDTRHWLIQHPSNPYCPVFLDQRGWKVGPVFQMLSNEDAALVALKSRVGKAWIRKWWHEESTV